MKKRMVLFAIFVFLVSNVYGISLFKKAAGTTGAQILKLPSSSGELAADNLSRTMGSADVVNNPALLLEGNGKDASFLYANWFADVNYGFVGFTKRDKNKGMGIGLKYINYGALQQRGVTDSAETSYQKFTANDIALSVGYALRIKNIDFGLTGNFIRQSFSIKNTNAVNGIAVTGGVFYKILPEFRVGAVIKRIGVMTQGNNILPELAVGADYLFLKRKNLDINGALHLPLDDSPFIKFGVGYAIGKHLNITAGFNSRYTGGQGVLYGLGTAIKLNISNISVGIGYSPQFFFANKFGGVLLLDMQINE